MAMVKQGNKGIPCTYCDEKALPDTEPPVCQEHLGFKKKASAGKTLKELEAQPVERDV